MNERHGSRRGDRYLRVGVALGRRSFHIASFWVVDQPAVQHSRLAKPILVHVDLAGQPAFVQAFDDPRIARGTAAEGRGHAYRTESTGTLYVSVPFAAARQLAAARVRLLDAAQADLAGAGVEDVTRWADDPPRSVRRLGEFTGEALTVHKDWPAAARQLGLSPDPGRVEIFLDRAGQYRWRIRRPDGAIAETSKEGFASLAACEAELPWARSQLAAALEVARDR